MAVRFRIDQAGSSGVAGQTRHDLDPSKAITLVVTEPLDFEYEWELTDVVGCNAQLSATTGASVTIPAINKPFSLGITLRVLQNGELVAPPEKRIASARTKGLGLRYPVFMESADPASSRDAPNTDASTDNAYYADLAGTGQGGQNWRGFASWAFEVTAALEANYDKPPGITARCTLAQNFSGDLNPEINISLCTAVILTAGTSVHVNGLQAPKDLTTDYTVELINGGSNAVQLHHGAATGQYPFDTGGSTITLGAKATATLVFDASNSSTRRWRVFTTSAGTVTGPNVSADNAIPRFLGTTGSLVENTGVYIDDNDNIILGNGKTIDGLDPSNAAARLQALETQIGQSAAPIHVYLRPTGDDTNVGTSVGLPRKTFAGAWELLPKTQIAPFTVHLASGTYAWTPPPPNVAAGQRACITVIGDGAGASGDDGHQVIRTATLATGSAVDKVKTVETLTAFAHHGFTLEITSGATAGCRRHVVYNGTADFTLSAPLPSVTTGQTLRITRPAVLIDMGAPNTTVRMPFAKRALINLANVRVRGGNVDFASSDPLCLFGVELESQFFLPKLAMAGATGVYPFWRDGQAGAQQTYFKDWTSAAGLTLADGAWEGWGLAATTATPNVSQYSGIDFYDSGYLGGYLTMPMINVAPGAADVTMRLYGGGVAAIGAQNPGLRIELFGTFYLGSPDWGGQEILRLLYDTFFWANAPLYIGQANYGYGFLTMSHNAKFLAFSTVTVQFTNPVATTQALLTLSGDSVFQASQLVITTAVNTPYLFDTTDTAKMSCAVVTAPTALKEGIARRNSVVNVNNYTGPVVATRESAVLAGVPRSTAPIHLYVAALAGLDTNTGLTAASPKQTLEAVYKLIPAFITVPVIIHMQGGTYAQLAPPPTIAAGPYGMIVLYGDGAGQPGQDGFAPQTTGTLGSGSTQAALVSTTTTMTVDQYVGMTVEVTSGPGQGCRRTIIANTASALSLTHPITDSAGTNIAPAAGVTYRIVRPSVVLDTSQTIQPYGNARLSSNGAATHYINVALAPTGTAPTWTVHDSDRPCYHWGMEWRGTQIYAMGSASFGGFTNGPDEFGVEIQRAILNACMGHNVITRWQGWGLAANPGTTTYCGFDGGLRSMTFGYFTNVGMTMGGGEVSMWILGGRLLALTAYRSGILTVGGTNPVLLTPPANLSAVGVQSAVSGVNMDIAFIGPISITQKGDAPAIYLAGGVRLTATMAVTVVANEATTGVSLAAVRLEGSATAYFYDNLTITSTTSAFLVRQNARMHCGGTLTGTQGNISACYGNANVHLSTIAIANSTGPVLGIYDNAKLTTVAGVTCTSSAPGTAVVIVQGGEWMLGGTPPKMVINQSTAANSDAVRCSGGGTIKVGINPTFSSAGASGYGVNLQGGGRFFCAVQPSLVFGATADFIVGPNSGEAFPDTELNVPFAARSAGASVVQRTA